MNIVSRASATARSWDRRLHRRYADPPLHLEIGGKHFKTTDWSLGGFRIHGYHQPVAIGGRLTGQIKSVNSNGPGTFVAEVVWTAGSGEIGLRLLEITPAVFVAMAALKNY